MRKKLVALTMAVTLVAGILSGCGSKDNASTNQTTQEASESGSKTTDWPNKTVEVIVPASAGGDTDFNARTFATYFKKYTGQSMVITNQGDGGGAIATAEVKDAKNDGYKMLFGHTGQLIVNEVSQKIDYGMDAYEIACIPAIDKGTVLVASASSGITSLEDLVEKAKANPDTFSYGTDLGGYSHLQGLILMDLADISLNIYDVGSASEKITNLLGGRVDLASISYGSVKDYAKTGELVVLAQFNNERNENLGDIPTFKEAGIDFSMEKPYIIAFPKETDQAIIDKMNEVVDQIAADEDYAKELFDAYNQPVDFLHQEDAVSLLTQTRDLYIGYQSLLAQ